MRLRRARRRPDLADRLLGPFFLVAGTLHFLRPGPYVAIVPPYIPRPREAVAVSGAAELTGGLAALTPERHGFARWWLTGLLLAVFPANLHMAQHPEDVPGLRIPAWLLWARLPVQGVLVAWVWRATRRR